MPMTVNEFFREAMKHHRFLDKRWISSMFCVCRPYELSEIEPYDVQWKTVEGMRMPVFYDSEKNPIQLVDYTFTEVKKNAPVTRLKAIKVTPDDIPNLKEPIVTTVGNLLANWGLVAYPFNHKIPYINRRFGVGAIEGEVEKRLKDDDEYKEDTSDISISEYRKYMEVAGMFMDIGLFIGAPSATEKTMTVAADFAKKKEEILNKYKGKLNDPAIAAQALKELREFDDVFLKGDGADRFLISGNSRDIVRNKTMLMYGIEGSFSDDIDPVFIKRALAEGVELEHLDRYMNNIREGSFDRGSQTQLGGAAAKDIFDLTEGITIEIDDCGDTVGHSITYTEKESSNYIGHYILVGGKPTLINNDNAKSFAGKPVILRSPAHCKAGNNQYCKTCVGTNLSKNENGVPNAVAGWANQMMYIFMKSMKGVKLATSEIDNNDFW